MRLFDYERADRIDTAVAAGRADAAFLAGGTTLLDLMKLDVMRPARIVDINALASELGKIELDAAELRLGALVKMAEAAAHPRIVEDFPVVAQSLRAAASTQLRNMATLGGNVLQRTRCNYFRDPSWRMCNKRDPGSGCAALDGVNRKHAVLGVSDRCIATYPGDLAQALVVLDASIRIEGKDGARSVAFEDLHRPPGETPNVETVLEPGELILGFTIPVTGWSRRSLFLKVRDRESYDFALASAAVALEMDGEVVKQARIGLGGLATTPWRAREAESALSGKPLTEASAMEAAKAAFVSARTRDGNGFKVELGQRTLVRALLEAAALEV